MDWKRYSLPAGAAAVALAGAAALAFLEGRGSPPDVVGPAAGPGRGSPAAGARPTEPAARETPAPAGTPRPGEALEIRGALVDEDGRPVEGSPVLLVPSASGDGRPASTWGAFLLLSQRGGEVPAGWLRAVSDRQGRFELRIAGRDRCTLLAGPPGHQEAWLELDLALASSPVEPTLMLRKGLAVRGRVLEEETGAGVPGVTISAFQRPSAADGRARAREAVSGPDGSFLVEGFDPGVVELRPVLPRDRLYQLLRSDPFRAEAGAGPLEIRVVGVGYVEFGAVAEGSAAPFPAAIRARFAARAPGSVLVTADRPGDFVLAGPSGAREYVLEAEGFAPVRAAFEVVGGSRTARPDPVVFRAGSRLSGAVALEGEGPDLVEQARVFYWPAESEGRRVKTVPVSRAGPRLGRYEIRALGPGTVRLVVLAPGHRAGRALFAAGEGDGAREFRLEPRGSGGPGREPGVPFRDRKDLEMDLDVQDLPLQEALEWIAEITGAEVRIRAGLEVPDRPATVSVVDQTLGRVLKVLAAFHGLGFDEEAGEIVPR